MNCELLAIIIAKKNCKPLPTDIQSPVTATTDARARGSEIIRVIRAERATLAIITDCSY